MLKTDDEAVVYLRSGHMDHTMSVLPPNVAGFPWHHDVLFIVDTAPRKHTAVVTPAERAAQRWGSGPLKEQGKLHPRFPKQQSIMYAAGDTRDQASWNVTNLEASEEKPDQVSL
jgi:hypothetical protein